MAKQKGIIKLEGSLGDISFYKNRYGYIAQLKPSIDKERLLTDPVFARQRENMQEFAAISRAGKYFRNSVSTLAFLAKDKLLNARVFKLMKAIKNLDLTSDRGFRNPGTALQNVNVRELLNGFEFNGRTHLGQVLFHPIELDTATGTITLEDFHVVNGLLFPVAATHVQLSSAWVQIDFSNGAHVLKSSAIVTLDRQAAMQTITLTPDSMPALGWTSVFLLKIEFLQVVNGVEYGLSDGEFNVMTVVGTAG